MWRMRNDGRPAKREADKKIEEAEQQTNVSLRAVPVITGLGEGSRRGDDDTVVVQWMRDKSLEVEPGGGDFTQGTAAPSISGFSRRFSFTRRSGTASARIDETAYIYTNIQSPGNRAFWKVYGFSPIALGGDNAPALAKGGTARAKTEIQDDGTTDVTEITVTGGRFNSAVGTFTCTTCMRRHEYRWWRPRHHRRDQRFHRHARHISREAANLC